MSINSNKDNFAKATSAVQLGRHSSEHFGMANMPICETSTIVFETLEDYFAAREGNNPYYPENKFGFDLAYGTSGTPTTYALQEVLSEIEGGSYVTLTSTGLSAITIAIFSVLKSGDHVIISDAVYGPTKRFTEQELARYNITATYVPPRIGKDIEQYIKPNTSLIFLESPSSFTMELQDVPAICEIARKHKIYTVLDNSWATPLYFDAFKHGVDIVVQALSKYVSGNSDVLIGSISTKNLELYKRIYTARHNIGDIASPYTISLALRGLRSMHARLKLHYENTLAVIEFLKMQKNVAEIFYPADPDSPDYEIWKRDFTGASSLFSFSLKDISKDEVFKRVNSLKLFSIGASWGGTESMVSYFDLAKVRTVTPYAKDVHHLRLSIGLEDPKDLINDLSVSFLTDNPKMR